MGNTRYWPDRENAKAAFELAESPGTHVCPECEGDGVMPKDTKACSLCHGWGVVTDERLGMWRRIYESQVLYHSGHKP